MPKQLSRLLIFKVLPGLGTDRGIIEQELSMARGDNRKRIIAGLYKIAEDPNTLPKFRLAAYEKIADLSLLTGKRKHTRKKMLSDRELGI